MSSELNALCYLEYICVVGDSQSSKGDGYELRLLAFQHSSTILYCYNALDY